MSEENNLVGRCCKNFSEYLVYFNGNPLRDYAVFICRAHFNTPPFDKNILKIVELRKINDIFKNL